MEKQNPLTRILNAVEWTEKCLSCAICLEIATDAAETRCGHLFCRCCIQKVLSNPGASCPVCKSNLTRRSVSSSGQMELARQQLSTLMKAIHNDSGIDVISCLKMHHERRPFMSMCSSSPRLLESARETIISKSKPELTSKLEKSAEKSIHEVNTRDDSNRNSTTIESKMPEIPIPGISSLPRIDRKNDLPVGNSSKQTVEDLEMEHISLSVNAETTETKPTQSTRIQENPVRFQKLGHLFKIHRKIVPFIYLGKTKKNKLSDDLVCKLCSCRIDEPFMKGKQTAPPNVPLSRARSLDSTSLQRRTENLTNNPKHVSLQSKIEDLATNVESNGQYCPSKRVSSSRLQTPATNNCSIKQNSNILKKRKRSKSPDKVRTIDQQNVKDDQRKPETEISCIGGTENMEVSHMDIENLSQILSPQATQTKRPKRQEIETNDINENSKRQNMHIDLQGPTKLQESNTTSNVIKSKETSLPNFNCLSNLSSQVENPVNENMNLTAIEENNEGSVASLLHSSMLNITREQEMLKDFEELLFAPDINEKKAQHSGANKKKRRDAESAGNNGSTEKRGDHDVDGHKFVDRNKSVLQRNVRQNSERNENSPHELTDVIFGSLREPSEIGGNEDVPSIPRKVTKRNKENINGKKKPFSRISRELKGARRQMKSPLKPICRPVYQSTPNPQQTTASSTLSTINSVENNISRFSALNEPWHYRGCILCSSLTPKQSEDVKYFAKLFKMEFTKKFTQNVSHVVVATTDDNNAACKTLKYLQAVAHRKWVVNFNWIVDCVSQQKLIDEGVYEVVDSPTLIPGPRKARLGENAPFDNYVFLCIEPIQDIPMSDYEDLLRQMGATVVDSFAKLAAHKSILKIISLQADYHENKIIEWHQITRAVPIAQEWVVECISQYRLVPPIPFVQELVPQDILDLGFPETFIQDDNTDFMYDTFT